MIPMLAMYTRLLEGKPRASGDDPAALLAEIGDLK